MMRVHVPVLLTWLVTSSFVSCSGYPPPSPPWGYQFWPEETGSVTFVAASGVVEEHPFNADCGLGTWEILIGDPPEWNPGWGPLVTCPLTDFPGLFLYDPSDPTTTLDWPDTPDQLVGGGWAGPDDFRQVELDVTIEVSEGALLDPLPESEPPPRGYDPATTPDYARRFRVQAEYTCADFDLDCDGTWFYDATYELSPDSVAWIYPPEE